jgi:hypothetical protein
MRSLIRTALLVLVLVPARAFAWGEDGHKAVCAVAWQRLTPQAHELVGKLLGANDENTFVDACVWADQIRSQRPETSAYHYINIPAGVSGMDMTRDCGDPAKRCAPWAIAHYAHIFANASAKEDDRRDALRFVIHFVGDIHQPLHAGRPEDLGGNKVAVDWFGNAGTAERPMNLHSIWDSGIIRHTNLKWQQFAPFLSAQIVEDEAAKWQTLDVIAWANDSYRVCEDFVYPKVPADGKLRNAYFGPAAGYVAVQIEKGGVRLAYLLNQAAAGSTLTFPFSA